MSPRDAAIALIKRPVKRGESLAKLRASRMGHLGPDYVAQIGGTIPGTRRNDTDYIVVREVAGRPASHAYKLSEIYKLAKTS